MIDVTLIREKTDSVRSALTNRGIDTKFLDQFLKLDGEWRELTRKNDEKRAELNKLSKERKIDEAKKVKTEIKKFEEKLKTLEEERNKLLFQFPNIPDADVPVGKDESENVVVRKGKAKLGEAQKDYLTIAEELELIDVTRSGKVAGSRFGYLLNEAVLLEFALVQFAFATALKEGFVPIIPPVMVRPEILKGMGKAKFIEEDDAFFLEKDNLYLAGSSEHTIGPRHANELFENKDMPRRYIGFSTCFRRESGSYGKDTKGILRVHQFDKAEMFSYTKPEDSNKELDFLVSLQEKMVSALGIPYQVVQICTGDMGFGDRKQFDIEMWMPSEGKYRETHSASNTGDFQSRGIGIKYRTSEGKTDYVHTLNATAFTMRTFIAILENFQTKKGTVKIPKPLVKYCGFKEIKPHEK